MLLARSTRRAGFIKPPPESAATAFPSRRASSPWLFFGAAFSWTWFFWIVAAASGASILTAAGRALIWLGLLGPMLSGIAFTYLTQDRAGRREYWARIVDLRRIPIRWYLTIFLLMPLPIAISLVLDVGAVRALAHVEAAVSPLLAAPLTIAPFLVGTFFYGPVPEELGWRGYALDRLQARWNALVSSLILGAIWALWHLPLFYVKDADPHYTQGPWSPWFWMFMAQVVATAVIFTWVFNNTRRSTLAAILVHFIVNLAAGLAGLTVRANVYCTVLWVVAAIAVVAIWGPATLTRREDVAPA